MWDSVLGFGVWCLRIGILEFEFSIMGFWVWDSSSEFGNLNFGV